MVMPFDTVHTNSTSGAGASAPTLKLKRVGPLAVGVMVAEKTVEAPPGGVISKLNELAPLQVTVLPSAVCTCTVDPLGVIARKTHPAGAATPGLKWLKRGSRPTYELSGIGSVAPMPLYSAIVLMSPMSTHCSVPVPGPPVAEHVAGLELYSGCA